jgi:ABC-type dipeptide/oligopeptide/nickel transport system ATPase component
MESVSPESVAITASAYLSIAVLRKIQKTIRSKKQVVALVMGSGSGKSKLAKSFNELYNDENYYFLDLEGIFESDSKIPLVVKTELNKLKSTDAILYHVRVLKLYKELLNELLPRLKSLNKKIVLLVSNRDTAKYLKIKRVYLAPDRKLYKEQFDSSGFQLYQTYCRQSLKRKKAVLYRDYDDLLTKIQQLFGITDKM